MSLTVSFRPKICKSRKSLPNPAALQITKPLDLQNHSIPLSLPQEKSLLTSRAAAARGVSLASESEILAINGSGSKSFLRGDVRRSPFCVLIAEARGTSTAVRRFTNCALTDSGNTSTEVINDMATWKAIGMTTVLPIV